MATRLTERFIASFKPEEGKKDRMVFDTDTRGLGVRAYRVTTLKHDGTSVVTLARSFICQWTDPATLAKRREFLGTFGGITLEQAREAVRARLGEVAKGVDPRTERMAKRAEAERERDAARLTLRLLVQEWERLALKDRRSTYRAEATRAIGHAFGPHLDKPAHHLTREKAVSVLDALAGAGKVTMAGRTMAYGRACFGWAVKRGKVPQNPFEGLPIAAGTSARDRVLGDDEIGEVWRQAGELGWPFGPYIRLLLLTAQRREEVAGMRWSEVNLDLGEWVIPAARAKNGFAHVVHLAPEARQLLLDVPRIDGSDFVFTTTGKSSVSGFSKAVERLNARLDAARAAQRRDPMSDWRQHDFRRTAVTGLAGAGVPPHIADKLLNHVTTTGLSDVARVYQKAAFLAERKKALEAWAAHIADCAELVDL